MWEYECTVIMFKLKDRQGTARFLFQQALYRRGHQRLFMAYLIGSDPSSCFNMASSLSSDLNSSPIFRKLVCANVLPVNRSVGYSYTLKACFDTNGYINNVSLQTKARSFTCLSSPSLLADLEDISVRSDGHDATIVNVDNISLTASPTKPLNFENHHLSQKLVVAVDVDEGMYVCMLLSLFPSFK